MDMQAVTADAADRARRMRTLTLGLLTLTYFFSYMDRQILAILQEDIIRDLKLSDFQMGILGGLAFALFYAGLGIPIASLADRWNRVRIIAIALTVWSGFTALGGLATSFSHLLLARIGVGIGEAGSSPPSHSIIADLYPPEKRAGAMSIYSLGVGVGAAFGTLVGGTVATYYGWRAALFVVGLPGVALALVIWLVMPEPKRGASDHPSVQDPNAAITGFLQGFVSLSRNRAAIHLIAAFTLTSMIGYGHTAFAASYLIRSFGYTKLQIAWSIAPAIAVAVAIGTILSGRLANRLARTNGVHAQAKMIAATQVIALPLTLTFYLSSNTGLAVGAYLSSLIFTSAYLGPTFSLIQAEAPLRQRAMWAAIMLFVNNLVGLGLGPTLVGAISDALKPAYGAESLRHAMLVFAALTPWATFHYWRAGVLLARKRAPAAAPRSGA